MKKIIKKMFMLLLTAVMLMSTMIVTTEAKKIGKIHIDKLGGLPVDDPYEGDGSWNIGVTDTLYCKSGDTFTLVLDDWEDEIKYINSCLNSKTDGKITWHTSDPKVAAVNQKGKVTIKGEGVAAITVTCMVTGKALWPGAEWKTTEETFYQYWIRSGKDEVLELKPTNLKSIAKKATKFEQTTDTRRFVRIKGSIQDNKELFLTYLEEVKKNRKKEIADGSLDWKEPKIEEYLYHNEIPCIQYFTGKSSKRNSYHMYQIGNFSYIE